MSIEKETIKLAYGKLDQQLDQFGDVLSPYIEKRKISAQDESLISDVRWLLEHRVSYSLAVITLRDALATISAKVLRRENVK